VKNTRREPAGQIRKSRGVGASDLARRVHVSRQTLFTRSKPEHTFPNTEVALNLAGRELEVTVDELFFAPRGTPKVALVSRRRGAKRRASGKRPARANMPNRVALGQRAGQRLSVLHARSRWHRQEKWTNE